MTEKIGKVSNPLTVIAIFAGLSEISGTVVLPFLTEKNQERFLYFIMLFPILLVALFFVTLLFKHKVLYAPSDYEKDKSFLDAAGIQTQTNISYVQQANEGLEVTND